MDSVKYATEGAAERNKSPSDGATGRSSAWQKAQTVPKAHLYRWCCIDLSRPPG
jgi:hypothetical protein